MIKVDIIIPSLISYQKYPIYKKLDKYLLFQKFAFPSWSGNWFPVWLHLRELKKMGIKIRFINYLNLKHTKIQKTVIFDSRILNNLIFKYDNVHKTLSNEIIPLLQSLRKRVEDLIFFDNADSTGNLHFEVFPYVNRYFKKQLLKDRSLYRRPLIGKRLFTDFYAKNYNLDHTHEKFDKISLPSKFEAKLGVSWNFALKDYRYSDLLRRFIYGFIKRNNLNFHIPKKYRKIILSANYTIKSSNQLVYFQRNQLLNILKQMYSSVPQISIGKIPKRAYLNTLKSSKAVVSPFGWGEICYRDFETYLAGAALIKPRLEHLDTWPNIYKEYKTYIPLPWEIESWREKIPEILEDEKNLYDVAMQGQLAFRNIWKKKGVYNFCSHFLNIVSP